ncbi:hypothetical protein [Piscibacillus salipiscarius]|uniref:hypothetical protein n=1 Tax=Piscibacillus salipiscarius TaxID=299480 RepID=UPI0006CF3FFF|nr:hypothetical protein [Piscibacillus salipiscarius]
MTIHIKTEANRKTGHEYYNNYLLQITVPLSTDHFSNIEAPDGTVATSGKNKQVTFTVMPEKDGNFTVEADAKQFEMDGIQINAMPSSMSIDSPDTGEMTSDMKSLSDATSEVNNGVGDLKNGISELANGIQDLQSGYKDYQNGINQLSVRSSEIINGSKQIQGALNEINGSLSSESGNMNVGNLKELQQGLYKMADGLKQTENGLNELNTNYQQAYQALDGAINEIPEHQITQEQIKKLYQSGADQKVIDQLVETYKSARKAKGTYKEVQQAFAAVPSTLDSVTGSLSEMRTNLRAMADELGKGLEQMDVAKSIQQLQNGLSQLSSNYEAFHSGLVKYTDGVSQLAHSYGDLHGGMTQLANGAHDLEDGAQELHNGTAELAQSTSDLPDEMQNEIDQMINEFDKSDFEPTSFVSPKNEKVETVQFVIKTENIKTK